MCERGSILNETINCPINGTCDPDEIALLLTLYNPGQSSHRNLYRAKILIEAGYDPNFKLETCFQGGSSFQHLVVYNQLLCSYLHHYGDWDTLLPLAIPHSIYECYPTDGQKIHYLTNTINLDNKMCLGNKSAIKQLYNETLHLVDRFLAHNADPNDIVLPHPQISLFHLLIQRPCIDLALIFLNSTKVDVNKTYEHKNYPVIDVFLKNTKENASIIYNAMRDTGELDINVEDCSGENIISASIGVGLTNIACSLWSNKNLQMCNLYIKPINTFDQYKNCCVFVPDFCMLFIPLLADSPVRKCIELEQNIILHEKFNENIDYINNLILFGISPFVDYIGCNSICEEVSLLVGMTNFMHLALKKDCESHLRLTTLILGQSTVTLQQLVVRKIFTLVIKSNTFFSECCKKVIYCSGECNHKLNMEDLKFLLKKLHLPHVFLSMFEIEAVKYQICYLYLLSEHQHCHRCTSTVGSLSENDINSNSSSAAPSSHSESDSSYSDSSSVEESSSSIFDDTSSQDWNMSLSSNEIQLEINDPENKAVADVPYDKLEDCDDLPDPDELFATNQTSSHLGVIQEMVENDEDKSDNENDSN